MALALFVIALTSSTVCPRLGLPQKIKIRPPANKNVWANLRDLRLLQFLGGGDYPLMPSTSSGGQPSKWSDPIEPRKRGELWDVQ